MSRQQLYDDGLDPTSIANSGAANNAPLTEAPDLQPWVPDSLRQRLVVGARVRFRVGECPREHRGDVAGCVCRIVTIVDDAGDGHPYFVSEIGGPGQGLAAAAELELLDDASGVALEW